ncbi:GCN5-related N-acetyltransferase [Enterobacter sp. FY-07]|uniref:GNAT family N-acetyltransferase n=1 Tax=Kosakonia oryzendophytica TaxID=1005665 RepID=UPI0007771DE1|nr:GNAT family N-acetyltransferase [Kosakonia oryzendophytica]AMO49163.1 GCN5-related N-acetyltransferase [Enterobacter sp. FY-07]WBT56367.1 GNAT family N-acetyltransferase [Kosakonia oryzendophytica]
MILFRSMSEKEYPAFLEYFISDYADEIQSNYRISPADSLARATKEISEMLAEGVNTHGQVLLCLVEKLDQTDRHVGYLWYKPDTTAGSVFIYDFHIFNSCQGMGLGKQTLSAFEEHLREKGFKEIRLRVAGDNVRARHIYESSGFGVTGVNMSKAIVT